MSQNNALLILTTVEETVATVPAALQFAAQSNLHLHVGVAGDYPSDVLTTLELLGLSMNDIDSAPAPAAKASPDELTPWLDSLVGQGKPALLMVPTGSTFTGICSKVAQRHQVALETMERDLPALKALIMANSDLTAVLERQLPFIPPAHKIIAGWVLKDQITQENYARLGKALVKLVEDGGVSVLLPVRMDLDLQRGLYENIDWHEHIHLLEPLEHLVFIYLLCKADLVVTRSSRVIEETKALDCTLMSGNSAEDILDGLEHRAKALLTG